MNERHLDRYVLREAIGSGGMAVVWRGHDPLLEREVAIKVMHPHLAGKEESRRRLAREARAVAKLRHPAIVEIYDYSGDEAEESYLVTEYIEGKTLRAFGEAVGFPLPEIAALVAHRLADALDHAHAQGVIHRDLKPENVMVGADGELKLMDFGIARMIGKDEGMTMTGALVGSPLHMAPEIIEGGKATAASDLFALGTVLYWMVTGEMAFQGNNPTHALRNVLEGKYTDPRRLAPGCPDGLAAVIERCLRREPAARHASAADLQEALAAVIAEAGIADPEAELRAFFIAPSHADELWKRIRAARLEQAEAAIRRGQQAKALACLDRVLAQDAEDPEAHALLTRLRSLRGGRQRRRIALAGLGSLVVLGIGWALWGGVDSAPSTQAGPPSEAMPGAPSEAPTTPAEVTPPAGASPTDAAPSAEGEPPSDALPPDDAAPPTEGAEPPAPAPRSPDRSDTVAEERKLVARRGEIVGRDAEPQRALEASDRTEAGEEAAAEEGEEAEGEAELRQVRLRWLPQGAVLSIDGERVATHAPAWNGELPVGSHRITLTHPDCCLPFDEEIEIPADEGPFHRSIALTPKENGWFTIDCEQQDAEVWFGGTFMGTVAEVNRRGGVPVAFHKDDTGRERYVKEVSFELLPPRHLDAPPLHVEVEVRAGQRTRSARQAFRAQARSEEPRP